MIGAQFQVQAHGIEYLLDQSGRVLAACAHGPLSQRRPTRMARKRYRRPVQTARQRIEALFA